MSFHGYSHLGYLDELIIVVMTMEERLFLEYHS